MYCQYIRGISSKAKRKTKISIDLLSLSKFALDGKRIVLSLLI